MRPGTRPPVVIVPMRSTPLTCDGIDTKILKTVTSLLNICTAQTYAVTGKTEKSALFMVEGRITRLKEF